MEEQLSGQLCEPDVGPEVQITAQQRAQSGAEYNKQTFRPAVIKAETEVERRVDLRKQLHRGAKPQLDRERDECMQGESTHHHVYPYTDMLPQLSEFDPTSAEEDSGPEADIDRELVEWLDGLMLSRVAMDQQISTIAVNLKVSHELLQQARRSLDRVEKLPQLEHREEDQVDSATRFRDAPSSIHTDSSCTSSLSSLSMSAANLSGISGAVGPRSKLYVPFPHPRAKWGKNLEAQLLSRDWELLTQEELALWLSRYPAGQQQYKEGWSLGPYRTERCSVGADHSMEEMSQYRSALDSSLPKVLAGQKQQTSSSTEKADITMEVCRPAASRSLPLDVHNTEYESFPNTFEDMDIVRERQAQHTPTTNMDTGLDTGLLAELSSITYSPAQPQEKLHIISVYRQAPPCNSTPRSPDVRCRVMTGVMEADLPDFPACSYLQTESFTTPAESSPPPFEVEDSASSPEGFITGRQENGLSDTPGPSLTVHRHCSTVEGEVAPEQVQRRERQVEMDGTHQQRLDKEEEEEDKAIEELEAMEEGLQLGCTKEDNVEEEEEEEGRSHAEEGSEEEEHDCFDLQRDVGSEVEEEEEEEDDINDRSKETSELSPHDASVKISELGVDTKAAGQEEGRGSPGSLQSPSLLEDTNRAHSTLDDVLQAFVMEGTIKRVTTDSYASRGQLFEGQAGDDKDYPAGDHAHTVSCSKDSATTTQRRNVLEEKHSS